MIYGYARVSTKGQAKDGNSLEAQEVALREAGAIEVYADAFTGTKAHRPQLDKLMEALQPGDKLVVTKLDRVARSTIQGIELIQALLDKGVAVHILNMGLLDDTPTGRLIRTVLLAFAQFERDMIVERTQEGKSVAKQNIKQMLYSFDTFFDQMNDDEKRVVIKSLISEIHLHPKEEWKKGKNPIDEIVYTFPADNTMRIFGCNSSNVC